MDLQRSFTFRNSKQTYTGIPIIAANMDTTGTFEMAQVLSKVSEDNSYKKINKLKIHLFYFVWLWIHQQVTSVQVEGQ